MKKTITVSKKPKPTITLKKKPADKPKSKGNKYV